MIQEVIPDKKRNAYLYDAVLIFNFILMLSFDSIQFLTKLLLQLITFPLLNFHTSSAPLLHKGTEKDMRSGGVQGADEPIERGRIRTSTGTFSGDFRTSTTVAIVVRRRVSSEKWASNRPVMELTSAFSNAES